MPPVGARQSFHAAHGAGGGQFHRRLWAGRFECSVSAHVPHQIGGPQGVLSTPALAVPHQPLAPSRDITPVVAVAAGEAQRETVLAPPDGILLGHGRGGGSLTLCSIFIRRIHRQLHLHAWAVGNEFADIKTVN